MSRRPQPDPRRKAAAKQAAEDPRKLAADKIGNSLGWLYGFDIAGSDPDFVPVMLDGFYEDLATAAREFLAVVDVKGAS